MAFELIITDDAQRDVDDAVQWYEEQQERLGVRFYLHVEQALDNIAHHPHHYAFIHEHYRSVTVKTFPFQVIFTIRENNTVLVLAFGILP